MALSPPGRFLQQVARRVVTVVLLLGAVVVPATAQQNDSLMLGQNRVRRDFLEDHGFLASTGRTLPKGAGWISAVVTPGVAAFGYGITDRLTVAAGSPVWTAFYGGLVIFASAKYSLLRTPYAHLSLGAFGITAGTRDDLFGGAWPFASVSLGPPIFTVGGTVGVGVSSEVFDGAFTGDVSLQGMIESRLGRNLKLIVETLYLGNDSDPVAAAGFRYFREHFAFELGVVTIFESDDPVVPWLKISIGR